MDKKFLVSAGAMVGTALLVVILGAVFNLWDIGFKAGSIIGLIIVLPAIIWVLSEGVNYFNSALYFGGIAYIMYRNIFGEFSVRFLILFIFLAVMAVAFGYFASLFEIDTESLKEKKNSEEKGQEEANG